MFGYIENLAILYLFRNIVAFSLMIYGIVAEVITW